MAELVNDSLAFIGRPALAVLEDIGEAAAMARSAFGWMIRGHIEFRQTVVQCLRIGADSLPVTMMVSFFTGMVLALQSGTTSQYIFNEPLYVGTVVGFAVVME